MLMNNENGLSSLRIQVFLLNRLQWMTKDACSFQEWHLPVPAYIPIYQNLAHRKVKTYYLGTRRTCPSDSSCRLNPVAIRVMLTWDKPFSDLRLRVHKFFIALKRFYTNPWDVFKTRHPVTFIFFGRIRLLY